MIGITTMKAFSLDEFIGNNLDSGSICLVTTLEEKGLMPDFVVAFA